MTNPTSIVWLLLRIKSFILVLGCSLSCSESKEEWEVSTPRSIEPAEKPFTILILGDSLTEGYGIDEDLAYPTLLEKKLNHESNKGVKRPYRIINGGISGSTTSGGVSRIDWFLRAKPDFLILALGGNDGLRGIPVEKIKSNLIKVVNAAQSNTIPVLMAGMKIPPNYGLPYSEAFSEIFPQIAKEYKIPLLPFLLEGVGGNPKMNLPDRIHPNPDGHRVIAETVHKRLIEELSSYQ